MDLTRGFVAIDWGTTSRRAWHVLPDGRIAGEVDDELGILAVQPGGFPHAVGELRTNFDDLPMLMGGMIGSNRGWVEAPYVSCPAGLEELAQNIKWVEPGRVGIVPGVALNDGERADVMRGEEVQILGAVADGLLPRDGLLCHPGTHNKWIELRDGCIASFRTVMTGELFNLLKKHSILSDLLAADVMPDAAFERGVDHGLENADLTSELFAVRARVLLGRAAREEAASYVSGLLIGSDLQIGLGRQRHDEVFVVGRPELTRLFAAALARAGRAATQIDGENAFIAGMRRIAEMVR